MAKFPSHEDIPDKPMQHLLGRIREDPWHAVEWKGVQEPEVASALISLTDDAIVDGRRSDALDYSAVARRTARKIGDSHLMCRAEACSGSVLRSINAQEFSAEKFLLAESLCDCGLCRGEVVQRRGVCLLHQGQFDDAYQGFNQALDLLEKEEEPYDVTVRDFQTCMAYLSRASALRFLGRLRNALQDLRRGADLIDAKMPPRISISVIVNIIWLIAADEKRVISSRDALDIVAEVQRGVVGNRKREFSRVRPFIRWCKALLYAILGENSRAEKFMNTAISGLIRNGESKSNITAARADRVLIKSWSRFPSEEEREMIYQLLEECDKHEGDETLFAKAIANPSPNSILQWRRSMKSSTVPSVSLENVEGAEVASHMGDGIFP